MAHVNPQSVVTTLSENPDTTEKIFVMRSMGSSFQEIADEVADVLYLTGAVVRKILHRQYPYQAPEMYSRVCDQLQKDALSVKRGGKGPIQPELPKVEPDKPNGTDSELLRDVLEADIAYQAAIKRAMDAGLDGK
jgi:hypothetical protein